MEDITGVWTDLGDAVREPPRYIIEGVLPSGIVFIAGPPKSQKTTLEMALTLLVAGYKNVKVLPPDMSKVVEPGRVVIMSAEHTAGELRDIVESGMGMKVLNDKSVIIADDPWTFRLDDPDSLEVLMGWLEYWKPKVFVIDPLVDFHSLEEKDAGSMNRVLRPIQKWAKTNGSCFIVIHHTTKKKADDKSTYKAGEIRGTGALFGIADGVIMLTPQEDGVVVMEATLKRGAGWKRAVRLGVWGRETESASVASPTSDLVFEELKAGARNYETIAKKLKVSKAKVVSAVKELKDSGRVRVVNNKLVVSGGK